jgi:AsmA-like C-terminal region
MKRRIFIACVSVLAIVVLCFGILIWKINPILASLKPEVIKLASEALKHPVTIGEISANLFPSIALEIENKAGKPEKNAKIGKLVVSSSISELLSGKISVKTINLIDSSLNLRKGKDGSLFLGNAILVSASPKETTGKPKGDQPAKESASTEPKSLSLAINEINVKNLNLTFVDKGQKTEQPLEIKNLNAKFAVAQEGNKIQLVSEIGDSESEISYGKLFEKQKGINFTITGNTAITLPQSISDPGLRFQIGNSTLTIPLDIKNGNEISAEIKTTNANLRDLLALNPEKKPAEIKGLVSANIKVDLTPKSTLPKLNGSLKISEGDIVLKDPSLTFQPFNLDLKFAENRILVSPLNTTIEKGTINANAEASLEKPGVFKLDLKGQGVELENVIKSILSSSKFGLTGTLSQLNLSATGETENLKPSLGSDFSSEINDGEIIGVNIFGSLLEELKGIPGIEGSIAKYVPTKYQELIRSPNTEFEALRFNTNIAHQNISLNEISLTHSLYKIQGQGTADFNGQAKINVAFHLGAEFSQELILKNEKLKVLSDPDGTIVIPATISKSSAKIIVLPDLNSIIKRAGQNTAKDAVGRVLDKKLGTGSKDLLNSIFK